MKFLNIITCRFFLALFIICYFSFYSLTVYAINAESSSHFNGDVSIGDSNSDALTINSVINKSNPFVFEGQTIGDGNQITLSVEEPTKDRVITLPDNSGKLVVRNITILSSGTEYSLTRSNEGVFIISSSVTNAVKLILPEESDNLGLMYTIKKANASGSEYSVTFSNVANNLTIDGSSPPSLDIQNEYITIVSDGTSWYKIGENSTISQDNEAPNPGNSGTILTSNDNPLSVTLTWSPASDTDTSDTDLFYQICSSTIYSNVNNISWCNDNPSTGWNYAQNITLANIDNLTPGTTYWFNVIVKDNSDNKSIYTPVSRNLRAIILYSSGKRNGNFGGRVGADSICAASITATNLASSYGYSSFHAFASFSTSDEIRDMNSNYSIPSSSPVWSDATNTSGYAISSSWNNLINIGFERQILHLSGALENYEKFWLATSSDGSFNATSNCIGFTSYDSGDNGDVKKSGAPGDTSDYLSNYVQSTCSTTTIHLMCVAW